jgi:hypothetical protein
MSDYLYGEAVVPTVPQFFECVDIADYTSLSGEEKTCYICLDDFSQQTPSITISKRDMEVLSIFDILPYRKLRDVGRDEPIRLPCNLVSGSYCLQHWLEEHGNSCPICCLQLCVSETE